MLVQITQPLFKFFFNQSQVYLPLFLFFFSTSVVTGTTIVPFKNLGDMASASEAVVLARATENFEIEFQGATRFRTKFQTLNVVSGNIADEFETQNYSLRIDDLNRRIDGDIYFEEGKKYFFFLSKSNHGYWQPVMLSYAVFEEHFHNGESILVPVQDGLHIFKYKDENGEEVEPLEVYYTQPLLSHLIDVVHSDKSWNNEVAQSPYVADLFYSLDSRTPPSHCTFLGDPSPWPRWQNFPGTSLPVWYHQDGDSGCGTANAKVQNAISLMNAQSGYGINLGDSGTHNYNPDCSSGATGTEFRNWMSTNLGGNRNLLLQYDDPCSEIADLTGCSGTLAIGGLYWFTSTHTHQGMSWNNAAWGYVVMNNGTGACLCASGTNYDIVVIHEITHALGIGHIASSNGAANMNPSCCNSIQNLDQQCVNYSYSSSFPVELAKFSANMNDEKKAVLDWATASETNTSHFEIQRSRDGEIFRKLTTVTAAGNSNFEKRYHSLDLEPMLGTNYYRLRIVDLDGSESFSPIRSVRFDLNELAIVDLFPNPATDQVRVRFNLPKEQSASIHLVDVTGRVMNMENLEGQKGENFYQMDIGNLSAGVYLMAIENSTGEKIVQRFVKR